MVSAMLLFNLLLFVALRDGIYLRYVAAVLFMALAIAANNGLFKEYFPLDSPLWSEISVAVGFAIAIAALLILTRSMLNTASTAPRLDSLIKLSIGLLVLTPVALITSFSSSLRAANLIYFAAGI